MIFSASSLEMERMDAGVAELETLIGYRDELAVLAQLLRSVPEHRSPAVLAPELENQMVRAAATD